MIGQTNGNHEGSSGYIGREIVETTEDIISLSPGKYYRKTNTSDFLTILVTGESEGLDEYCLEFSTSYHGTTITLPDNVKWKDSILPTFENRTKYVFSIVEGLAECTCYGEDTAVMLDTKRYLTIVALEDGLQFSCNSSCEYCIDGDPNTWTSLSSSKSSESINAGHTISIRRTGNTSTTISATKRFNATGCPMSIISGDSGWEQTRAIYLANLFKDCTTLVNVSKDFLPYKDLGSNCYKSMFYGCTSLETCPDLPAIGASSHCYDSMFFNCTSLVEAPEISLQNTTEWCCSQMFYYCTSLRSAPVLYPKKLSDHCYYYMFSGCSNLSSVRIDAVFGSRGHFSAYNTSITNPLSSWLYGTKTSGTITRRKIFYSTNPYELSPNGWNEVYDNPNFNFQWTPRVGEWTYVSTSGAYMVDSYPGAFGILRINFSGVTSISFDFYTNSTNSEITAGLLDKDYSYPDVFKKLYQEGDVVTYECTSDSHYIDFVYENREGSDLTTTVIAIRLIDYK